MPAAEEDGAFGVVFLVDLGVAGVLTEGDEVGGYVGHDGRSGEMGWWWARRLKMWRCMMAAREELCAAGKGHMAPEGLRSDGDVKFASKKG